MRNMWKYLLSAALILSMGMFFVGCELDEEEDATDEDTYVEPGVDTVDPAGPCDQDNYCNNASTCGGGSPKDWSPNTDPDCGCDCNYYPGICEAKSDGSDEACACDYDCMGGGVACNEDDHCDSWCPEASGNSIDPDCPQCDCHFYAHVCEAGDKCSTSVCACDPDCEGGVFTSCASDGHCDSWCPTDEDPDCADLPDKNGKYCN